MASLYRRHRPRTFADVVGQEHVVRTLSNAIEQDKVHHAYLFVGSRGTGKTSMAKILAASLNCVHGPTTTPDGTCESCRSIHNATSLDVIEMDAASNNSVDDIRDLREKVAYAPVSGRHKVYILDEAHMLSTQAWNAFLKTLEEPPPHTIFVLATTEAQKVLPTVVDRCHRFDFSRPTITQIASVLHRVAQQEQISAPDEALALIARSATGSFRDALGTLEQLVAYSGTTITLQDVLAVLGAADSDLLFGTVDAVATANAADALRAAARLAESGRDVSRFFADLEAHLRGLMIVQTLGGEVPAELRLTDEADARLVDQARRTPLATVTQLLDLLADGLRAMKDGADARTQLELALVKAADPARDASQKALLARIERLERGQAPLDAVARTPVRAPEQPATAAGQALATPPTPTPEPVVAAVAVAPVEVAETEEPAVAIAVTPVDGVGELRELWPAILKHLEGGLGSMLGSTIPLALDEDRLTVAFSSAAMVMFKHADKPANRDAVAAAVRAVTGRALRVKYELRTDEELEDEASADTATLSEQELVDRMLEEFDAIEEEPGGNTAVMNMPPNINKMLEQAQKMQEDMALAQEKLAEEKIEASSGGGMVKVVVTGAGRLESLTIDPDAVDPEDVEMLSDMVLAATNEALRQADELREKAMGDTAGFDPMEALSGLGLGGLGGGGGGGLPGGMPPGGGGGNRAARRSAKKKR